MLATACLERILTLFTFSAELECLDQRDLSIGETASTAGFYHWLAFVSLSCVALTLVAVLIEIRLQGRRNWFFWAFPTVNVLISMGVIALSAIPWAYFNVGHPLSDRIYQVRSIIAPEVHFWIPEYIRTYSHDPEVWDCTQGTCSGDPDDLTSEFRHRELGVSFKNMVISECMSPDFNLATKRALGDTIDNYTGDKRRFARIYFDEFGRFVGPFDRWAFTNHLKAQLTDAQLQPSHWNFNELLIELYTYEANTADQGVNDLPNWIGWEQATAHIRRGDVQNAYMNGSMFGLELKDGTSVIGTQPSTNALENEISICGEACESITLVRSE